MMQDSFRLSALFSDDAKNAMRRVIEFETENFSALVQASGLDPKSDFRHANLDLVNFDNSDLRGFDFTGASLKGASGSNVQWDETTVFTDAKLDQSIFASAFAPLEQAIDAEAFARTYWPDLVMWMDQLSWSGKDAREDARVLLHLVQKAPDSFVRRRALQVMARQVHPDQIFAVIEQGVFEGEDKTLVPVAFKLLDDMFDDHQSRVLGIATKHLKGRWAGHAAAFLARNIKSGKQFHALMELMSRHPDAAVRRQFISIVVERYGPAKAHVTRDPVNGDVFDFGESISARSVDLMARAIDRIVLKELNSARTGPYVGEYLHASERIVEKVLDVLAFFRALGTKYILPTYEDVIADRRRRKS